MTGQKGEAMDLIERHAAIDLVRNCPVKEVTPAYMLIDKAEVMTGLMMLSPAQPEQCWETCFDCPLSHGCPKIKGCTNEQAEQYAGEIPIDCPLDKESAQPEQRWIPCSERLPSKEERKEWIDKNLDGIGYLYPCLVTRYSRFDSDRAKNNPYVAKHYFDGKDFLNAGEEVCSEYIVAWMPLPKPYAERTVIRNEEYQRLSRGLLPNASFCIRLHTVLLQGVCFARL